MTKIIKLKGKTEQVLLDGRTYYNCLYANTLKGGIFIFNYLILLI